MRRRALPIALVAALCVVSLSCRSGRPAGIAIQPLAAASPEQAMQQLRERRLSFRGARSLMRVRATVNGRTQSFRAQLTVRDAQQMELQAYTPVGTTALTLSATGQQVSMRNHVEGSEWEGNASELARSLGFLGSELLPAEVAMLILGLPPREGLIYEAESAGLLRAIAGDLEARFEPPAYPAARVVVIRGADRIEIDHLEVVE